MFGIPFGAFQKSADANYFRRAAMWEVIRVANRLGVDIGQNEIDRQEHTIGRLPYQNKPSTLQDLEAGKHTEVDMFAGTVVRLGKELGVETPVCEMFWHGIHLIEDRIFGNIWIPPLPCAFSLPLLEPQNRRGKGNFIFYGQRALARAAAPSCIFSSVRLAYPRITVRLSVSFFPI